MRLKKAKLFPAQTHPAKESCIMHALFLVCLIILTSTFVTFGQQVLPKSTPPRPDDEQVVKITSALIRIDVNITDKKGRPVRDIRQDEIEVFENGKKQDISSFSFVSDVFREEGEGELKIETPAGMPAAPLRPENVRRTVALVVDDLSLSFPSVFWVKNGLRKFVDEQMQEGDLVAIIRTGAGIGALQQFTTDKRQLHAAIDKLRFNMAGSGSTDYFNPIAPTLKEQIDGTTDSQGNTSDLSGDIAADRAFERENANFRENVFAGGTLGALNYIIRGMDELPGRKSVVLLSDGLRLVFRDDQGRPKLAQIFDPLRRLIDQANRASIVVYTIDARGLIAPIPFSDDDTYGLSEEQIEQRLRERSDSLFDSQEGLTFLARQTGGRGIINSNDIAAGLRSVLQDQSYYLVSYQPDGETFDPKTRKFNRLDVRVSRPGVHVRYRSGFFGVSTDDIPKPKGTATQNILNALTSPFGQNDIALRLNAMFIGGEDETAFVRSYLHVDAEDLTFDPEPDGSYKTTFDLVALAMGDNGKIASEVSKSYTVNLPADAYQRVLTKGFVYHFTFPVKKAGGYQVRVALRDSKTNTVGSANQFVSVPNLRFGRLTLSGIVFETVSPNAIQTERLQSDDLGEDVSQTDPLIDTSLRQFDAGKIVRFAYSIHGSRLGSDRRPDLTVQIRLFRDGKVFYESVPAPIIRNAMEPKKAITASGSFRLGDQMPVGDYVLEIKANDNLAKGRAKTASTFVQFEVVGD